MGKTGKQRKKRRMQREPQEKKSGLVLRASPASPDTVSKKARVDSSSAAVVTATHVGGLALRDIAATVRTLTILGRDPSLFQAKPLKQLRIAVHAFHHSETWAQTSQTAGKTLSGRVSDALRDRRLVDAHRFLDRMKAQKLVPKVGALQRWVRDCDAAGGSATEDPMVWRVLDAMLRLADPARIASVSADSEADASLEIVLEGRLRRYPHWTVPASAQALAELRSDVPLPEKDYKALFRVVARERGVDRRPPNKHDWVTYLSEVGTIEFERRGERSPATTTASAAASDSTSASASESSCPSSASASLASTTATDPASGASATISNGTASIQSQSNVNHPITVERFDVPFVAGAFLMRDVLSPRECQQMIRAAETVGYLPDEPLNGTRSVLAHNFVWLADQPLIDEIYERVRPHLPATLDGVALAGLNPNWRLFRYRPGAEYRPHIDGSWPGSGLVDGEWKFDADGTRWSKLTFLLYLSDDFEGGCTTFFAPSSQEGLLNARGVKPRTGSVLCFPHGSSNSALLHEGTGVTCGTKYIIRGDVLYYK